MGVPITVAYGDGIGPEIMSATLEILGAAGADIVPEEIQIGKAVYERGVSSGIEDSAWDSLRRTKVFLKAPITTPQGGGVKSLNVTVRKTLGLFANVRPCIAYSPFVKTLHPNENLVIVRENEEGLYGGIEHQQTPDVVQTLKVVSVPGCERVIRYAFEYAKRFGRKKVTAMTKDNILKIGDGLFHKVFDRTAKEYPDIETSHLIIDIGIARVADTPEKFDVIVLPNLYGDILSDVASQISGSVGLAGSANIGEHCAMFEAVHGSAPDIAGKDVANPSGLLLGAVQMLLHIGQPKVAEKVHNAWLTTIEGGIHTVDIYNPETSKEKVGTKDFAQAVIERLGQKPTQLKPVHYDENMKSVELHYVYHAEKVNRKLVGIDLFVYWNADGQSVENLYKLIEPAIGNEFELKSIANRGTKVWPDGAPETFCTDHWCVRFYAKDDINYENVIDLQQRLTQRGVDIIKSENLYTFNGERGFSLGQGE